MTKPALIIALAWLAFTSVGQADPRIRTQVYAPDKVIRLIGHYGYQIAIELPPAERIESIALGDAATWQATPNKRGNVLFVKPVDEGEPTNMTVMTGTRTYSFELIARRRDADTSPGEITYLLRITEPAIEAAPATPAALREPELIARQKPVNRRYSYKGSMENLPSRVYDDGVSTVFEWPAGVETPAIFYRRPDGAESIVNYSYKDGAIVVHVIAAEFILRNGREVTQIFNDGFAAVERGPDAPQPRRRKKGGPFGLFGE
jgi:type IV secretion system protein VirB9